MNEAASNPQVLNLEGDLTLETVAGLYRALTPGLNRAHADPALDLEKVGRIDSAGLALLLEWRALAKSRGWALELRNAPDDLLQLARLCEASDLLGIDHRGASDTPEPEAPR